MNDARKGLLLALGTVGFVSGLFASGCLQSSGLTCTAGTVECNVTCVDIQSDEANCGSCGNPCQPGAVCQNAACACPGNLEVCSGSCTDTSTDRNNCGACASAGGAVCMPSEVCGPLPDGGAACQLTCGTAVECNGSCVTLETDPNHCGTCDTVCPQGYGCHPSPGGPLLGTCIPDLVVACLSTSGAVAPIRDNSIQPVSGAFVSVGSLPGALGILGDGLLVADEALLRELALEDLGTAAPESPPLGSGPNFVEVDSRSDAGSWVYVVNSNDSTISVLGGPPASTARILLPDGGIQGLGLAVTGGYAFGPNAFPEPFARVGDEIFVPVYGGFPPDPGGGQVLRLDVSNPSVPVLVGIYDLNGVNLQTFDGGAAFPRPSQAIFHEGFVYVVLNNLDENYGAAGPSFLVKLDPFQALADAGVGDAGVGSISQVVTLDPTVCLDAVSMTGTDQRLLVSCFGQAQFDSNFNTVAVDRSGVLLLDVNDALLSSWSPQCPDAGPACTPPIAGRLAVVNNRAYVGDQSAGRVFVVTIGASGQLTQLLGYSADGGVPLQPCPTGGLSSASDVIRVP